MYLERLCENNSHLFDAAFKLYESAFPNIERRNEHDHNIVMKKADYHFDLIINDGKLIGIMLYWETPEFVFLEHFSTLPTLRGNGYGKKALDLLKKKNKKIILEIEPPVDQLTERRYGFYKRNGFEMTPHHHIQAKYHVDDQSLVLKILSYPHILTDEEYSQFRNYISREIELYK